MSFRYQCICGDTFGLCFDELLNHLQETNHMFACSCQKTFNSQKLLSLHQRHHNHTGEARLSQRSRPPSSKTVDFPPLCNQCKFLFANSDLLEQHQRETGHTYVLQRCPTCEQVCGSTQGVKDHRIARHHLCPSEGCALDFETEHLEEVEHDGMDSESREDSMFENLLKVFDPTSLIGLSECSDDGGEEGGVPLCDLESMPKSRSSSMSSDSDGGVSLSLFLACEDISSTSSYVMELCDSDEALCDNAVPASPQWTNPYEPDQALHHASALASKDSGAPCSSVTPLPLPRTKNLGQLQCQHCGAQFEAFNYLLDHITVTGHMVVCSCLRTFEGKTTLTSHQERIKHEGKVDTTTLPQNPHAVTCECGLRLRDRTCLELHRSLIGHEWTNSTGPSICPLCNCTWGRARQNTVQDHIAANHPACPVCHQLFAKKEALYVHYRSTGHTERDPRVCPVCDRRIKTPEGVRDHMNVKHASTVSAGDRLALQNATPGRGDSNSVLEPQLVKRTQDKIPDTPVALKTLAIQPPFNHECTTCECSFHSQAALDEHLQSQGHAAVAVAIP